ncbi:hypothetical protein HYH02_000669 [Chlamydomonas schloesseri]|uniref:Uncharacterized protein n=1 Tax=Chlamydomonas schloesseri TaxID=2026947 RepID=A0A836BCU7_9CHLO|nr:hypothetical protein HYH02_000669 [Chlamydomonas schloesseri]|eukprot:KAG2454837.1 hypothetical protein HYH02_000669 [Chlamydomonas schloesseri]
MTRVLAPSSLYQGSLLFPVEIPGLHHESRVDCQPAAARSTRGKAPSQSSADLHAYTQTLRPNASAVRLLEDVRSLKRAAGGSLDAAALAQALRGLGYEALLACSSGSHSAPSALRLAHEFVVVRGCGAGAPLIVEPSFREHFAIGSLYATERYRQVLAAVPEELVAPYTQLSEMVRLVCAEMKFSFEATGNSLPPWRNVNSVMSRWGSLGRTA